jgi:predicted PurR-regulated permease PerM
MERKILLVVIIGAIIYFLYPVLILLFLSFLLTTAFLPIVKWLKTKNIPRVVSSVILVVALLGIPVTLLVSLAPMIAEQGSSFIEEIPELTARIENRFDINISQELQNAFTNNSENLVTNAFSLTGSVITFIAGIVIVLVLTIYWLIYYNDIKIGFIDFLSTRNKSVKHKKYIVNTITAIENRLGTWVGAQLLISAVVGIITWVVLSIIGFPYAGILALIAAFLEIIPTLGPILASVPALLIAITISPTMFILILITYISIQQFESYVIGPRLLGHTLKLNPFVILLALIVGGHLLGIIGALIAIPVVLTAHEIYLGYNSYSQNKK